MNGHQKAGSLTDSFGDEEDVEARSSFLLGRCNELAAEIVAFQDLLKDLGRPDAVELRKFRASVTAERDTLRSIFDTHPKTTHSAHSLKSSNLPFHEAVWTRAKSCEHITALGKRFDTKRPRPGPSGQLRKNSVVVDVVADDSETWIKVFTMTERRLLLEIAEAGWGGDFPAPRAAPNGVSAEDTGDASADDAGSSSDGSSDEESDAGDGIGLVKVVEELQVAAAANRVRWRAPRLRLVLTRIREGVSTDIDGVLARIRLTGARIESGENVPPCEDLQDILPKLLPSIHAGISRALNLDCTILLALISDISHTILDPLPSLQRSVCQQTSSESVDNLLPGTIFPVIAGRALHSAVQAVQRMREITETLGTPTEKERAMILFGEGDFSQLDSRGLRAELSKRSVHPVPRDLQLPARVVPEDTAPDFLQLPQVARKLDQSLSRINSGVFFLGWRRGWTTITSNRAVVRSIEGLLKHNLDDNWVGPNSWVCPTARSLLGKEKERESKRCPKAVGPA